MKQIIALGGGGFSMEPNNPLLDQYILKQSKKNNPNICFLPTASGDSANYIARFYDFFQKQNCIPTHFSVFNPSTRNIEDFLLQQDIIYVGGGNTKNLLILWKEWGIDKILEKALLQGTILTGISAGSLCWFESGITDSFGDGLEPIHGLGFISGSNCPHYDGEAGRRQAYHKWIQSKKIAGGLAADDGVAIHFVDGNVQQIVSSRPNAKAYKVELSTKEKKVIESEIVPWYLG
ncbi:peptidase E [Caldibacillus lycopersici]|uniref:Peptidase E n=1 Tax=Perspicuibacillus lycopersici TaxID=1325689 RepID=A0AAE3IUP0_9BACI|nr:peptidase E [Perspicuibacillus lycopersici]MCU9614767.1 peptidase E [Perspicuibacillus lycopersici]